MRTLLVFFALTCTAVAVGCVAPSNAYDPDTDPAQQVAASVVGSILLEEEGAAIEDLSAELRALEVTLADASGNTLQKQTGADLDVEGATARFVFQNVTPGTVQVTIGELDGRFLGVMPGAFSVFAGETYELGTLRFVAPYVPVGQGTGSIEGEVQLSGGTSGTRSVELFRLGAGSSTSIGTQSTSPEGQFLFSGLPSGTYAVVARAEGYRAAYALDLNVTSDGVGVAKNRLALTGTSALVLDPISTVLRFADSIPLVNGTRYTNQDQVELEVLTFTGAAIVQSMRVSSDPAFVDDAGAPVAFGPYAATVSVPLPPRQGPINVYAQFEVRSAAGFIFLSDIYETTVVRDIEPPTVWDLDVTGVYAGSDGALYLTADSVAPTLRMQAQDDASGIYGYDVAEQDEAPSAGAGVFTLVDAALGWFSEDVPLAVSAEDGAKTLWVRLRDRAGNESASVPVTIVVDTQAPVITSVVIAGGAGTVLASSVSIDVSCDDADVEAVSLTREGEGGFDFVPFSGHALPFVLTPGDGERRVTAYVRDYAGNISEAVEASVTVDGAVYLEAPSLWASLEVPVEISAVAMARARAYLGPATEDGAALLQALPFGAPPSTVLAPVDGAYRIWAQVEDAGGTRSTIVATDVVVDTTAPTFGSGTVQIDGGAEATRFVSVDVSIDVADADDVASIAIATDGVVDTETFFPFTPVVTTLLPAGDCVEEGPMSTGACKSVCVVLRDAAGNLSDPQCDDIRLDTTPPSTPVISPLFGRVRHNEVALQLLEPSTDFNNQPVSSYEITSLAGDYLEVFGEGPFPCRLRPDRQNELCVRGKDAAGNVGIEDCAVVSEESHLELLGNGIPSNGSDLFGDHFVVNTDDQLWVFDVRLPMPTSLGSRSDPTWLSDGVDYDVAPEAASGGVGRRIRVGADLNTLYVAHGPLGPDQDRFNLTAKTLDEVNLSTSVTVGGVSQEVRQLDVQFIGRYPDVDRDNLVFSTPGGVYYYQIGLRGALLHPERVTDATIAAHGALRLSEDFNVTGAQVCPGTGPKIAGNAVIWCELQASGNAALMRFVAASPATLDQNDDGILDVGATWSRANVIEEGRTLASLGTSAATYRQPLMTRTRMFWLERDRSGTMYLKMFSGNTAQDLSSGVQQFVGSVPSTCGDISLEGIEPVDAEGNKMVFLMTNQEVIGLNDVGVFPIDFNSPSVAAGAACITNDIVPQSFVSIDNNRVTYRVDSVNVTTYISEQSRTRWVNVSQELQFDPISSGFGGLLGWIETRPKTCNTQAECSAPGEGQCVAGTCNGALRTLSLLVRGIRTNKLAGAELQISSSIAFVGSSEAAPSFVLTKDRIAWLEASEVLAGPPYTLRSAIVSRGGEGELALTDVETLSDNRAAWALDFAQNSSSTRALLAYVEAPQVASGDPPRDPGYGVIKLWDFGATTPGPIAVPAATTPTNIPFVQVETHPISGQSILVWQQGGWVTDRESGGDLMMSVAGAEAAPIRVYDKSGEAADEPPIGTSGDFRSPKLAVTRRGADVTAYMAYLRTDEGLRPHICELQPTLSDDRTYHCVRDQALPRAFVKRLALSPDGVMAYTSDEIGLDQIVLYDALTRRRWFATRGLLDEGARKEPHIYNGHLVWVDESLGVSAILEQEIESR